VHGADAKLTDLLVTLANCEKAPSLSLTYFIGTCIREWDSGPRL
jgi:hypothetical protein